MILPYPWGRKKSCFDSFLVRLCWEWGHRRVAISYIAGMTIGDIDGVLSPPGFSGIWYFLPIGLELKKDLIFSGSVCAGNGVTGGSQEG